MPTIEIAGKQIETTEMGYLINAEDWSNLFVIVICRSHCGCY